MKTEREESIEFASFALSKANNVTEILQYLANRFLAFGCVLWEASPYSRIEIGASTGSLYTLASWFAVQDEVFAMHNLPASTSATGHVVAHRHAQWGHKCELSGAIVAHSFLLRYEVEQLCSVPLPKVTIGPGAISLYRRRHDSEFTERDKSRLEDLAIVLPDLLESLQRKVVLKMLNELNRISHASEASQKASFSVPEQRGVVQKISNSVALILNCREVSVFLSNSSKCPKEYELVATTWTKTPKITLIGSKEEGLTGWVLSEGKPVHILSIVDFEKDYEFIQKSYPGLRLAHLFQIIETTRSELKVLSDEELPPISYIGVPIWSNQEIVGVIRCTSLTTGPYYFSPNEELLLGVVAEHIGQMFLSWSHLNESNREQARWREIATLIDTLSLNAVKLILERPLAVKEFLDTLAKELPLSILGTTLDRVFLRTIGTDNLDVIYIRTQEGPSSPPSQNENAIAQEALLANEAIRWPQKPGSGNGASTATSVVSALYVPLGLSTIRYGALRFSAPPNGLVEESAVLLLTVLGRQLGLLVYLARAISQRNKAEAASRSEHDRIKEERIRAFQDLSHQLMGPLILAAQVADGAVDSPLSATQEIHILRSLCRTAERVVKSMSLWEGILSESPILMEKLELETTHLLALINQVTQDAGLLYSKTQLSFSIDRESLRVPAGVSISVDYRLLAYALSNILDNACKYSRRSTLIKVNGGVTHRPDGFYLAVMNRGIRLSPEDALHCRQHGWRGEEAKLVTGNGSGIGLFIADKIMEAHGGKLVPVPTGPSGYTEFRLEFKYDTLFEDALDSKIRV